LRRLNTLETLNLHHQTYGSASRVEVDQLGLLALRQSDGSIQLVRLDGGGVGGASGTCEGHAGREGATANNLLEHSERTFGRITRIKLYSMERTARGLWISTRGGDRELLME